KLDVVLAAQVSQPIGRSRRPRLARDTRSGLMPGRADEAEQPNAVGLDLGSWIHERERWRDLGVVFWQCNGEVSELGFVQCVAPAQQVAQHVANPRPLPASAVVLPQRVFGPQ